MIIRLKSDILTEFDLEKIIIEYSNDWIVEFNVKKLNAIVVNALDVDRSHQQRSANNTEYLSAGLG